MFVLSYKFEVMFSHVCLYLFFNIKNILYWWFGLCSDEYLQIVIYSLSVFKN